MGMHITLSEIQKMALERTSQYIDKGKLPRPVMQASSGICHGGVSQWYWDRQKIEVFFSQLAVKES
jgi:hypothetical protein